MNDNPVPSNAQRRAAADWFARLNDAAAEDDAWQDFMVWLETDPAHCAAYDEVEALWVEMDDAGDVSNPAPADILKFAPRARPVAPWAFAGLAAAAAAAALIVGPQLMTAQVQTYETAAGQSRTVTLSDGSKIALNGGAKVEVTYKRGARSASLVKGEADFDIFHDPARPFTVAVGDNAIRVLGTQFDVVRRERGLTVSVERGLIAVTPTSGGTAVQVAAGRQLRRQDGRDEMRDIAVADAAAWRSGRLVYREAPLREVAEDLSRYGPLPISVEPGVANLKVTAVLKLDAEEAMVDRLQSFLPIKAETSAAQIQLRSAGAHP
jgi:transmembrane sensor